MLLSILKVLWFSVVLGVIAAFQLIAIPFGIRARR